VRVDDGDSNLQSVIIYTNATGLWTIIYNSGALGGVASHNTSKFKVSLWTGSWKKYWFNVTANDGTDHMFQYSFTTEYVFGDMQSVMYNDLKDYRGSPMYKFAAGKYYVALYNYTNNYILVKQSSNGVDWFNHSAIGIAYGFSSSGYGTWNIWDWFTYNNTPSFLYCSQVGKVTIANYTGTSWKLTSTGINGYSSGISMNTGAAIAYFDGKWCLLVGTPYSPSGILGFYRGTPPATWTLIDHSISDAFYPSLNIVDGYLVLTYMDNGNDFHWQIFDGVTLTDKGDVSTNDILSLSVVKDPVSGYLAGFYTRAGDLYYRILTSPTGTWSSEYNITATRATYTYVYAQYIDHRMVLTFANNIRLSSTNAIYMMSAPDYSSRTGGLNTSYNRIVFPDAAPTDTHVLSNIFTLKNIDNRDILTIRWHANNIGSIPASSNMKFWTNMSGSWVGYAVDAAGNTSSIDISAASGSEWTPGETMYWKLEILSMMGVAETLHSTDEDIYYTITF
jgi:hypothetical protein